MNAFCLAASRSWSNCALGRIWRSSNSWTAASNGMPEIFTLVPARCRMTCAALHEASTGSGLLLFGLAFDHRVDGAEHCRPDNLLFDDGGECLGIDLLDSGIDGSRNLALRLETTHVRSDLLDPASELTRSSFYTRLYDVIGRTLTRGVTLGSTTDVLSVLLDCG